jgi:hypothetical protein
MKKRLVFLIIIFFSLLLSGCKQQGQEITNVMTGLGAVDKKIQADNDLAVAQAKDLYRQAITLETDISAGPCLANNLMPDWVADIAHNPRQPVDDKPENQCSAFREGLAHHFVELDLNGNVINIK